MENNLCMRDDWEEERGGKARGFGQKIIQIFLFYNTRNRGYAVKLKSSASVAEGRNRLFVCFI